MAQVWRVDNLLRADPNLKAETPAADWWTARSLAMADLKIIASVSVSCETVAIKSPEQTGFRVKNMDASRPATLLAPRRSTWNV
jgi:hypothetical protein